MSVLKIKRRFILISALFALFIGLLVIIPTWSPVQAIELADEGENTPPQDEQPPVNNQPLCYFFTETGSGQGGFSVTDEGGVKFASAFQQWGLIKIGYPISHRYERDGFVTQAFQKAIMQWRPDSNSVALVNIFDDLHNAGYDDTLETTRQIPQQLPPGWDGDLDFNGVVKKRQGLLAVRPALSQTYFASGNPLTFYGLPASEVKDMDSHFAIRLQRAVLQEWKIEVPWAKKGEVTIANGGDITKELGALTGEVTVPIQNGPCPRTTAAPLGTSNNPALPAPEEAPAPPAPEETPLPPVVEETPAPTQPPAEETPVPPIPEETPPPATQVCSEDLALVQFDNGLGQSLTLYLTGPSQGTVIIPPNGSANRCMTKGAYQFSTESETIRSISGEKVLVSTGCECWKLFFLFPSAEPCTCSANPIDYTPLQP